MINFAELECSLSDMGRTVPSGSSINFICLSTRKYGKKSPRLYRVLQTYFLPQEKSPYPVSSGLQLLLVNLENRTLDSDNVQVMNVTLSLTVSNLLSIYSAAPSTLISI